MNNIDRLGELKQQVLHMPWLDGGLQTSGRDTLNSTAALGILGRLPPNDLQTPAVATAKAARAGRSVAEQALRFSVRQYISCLEAMDLRFPDR